MPFSCLSLSQMYIKKNGNLTVIVQFLRSVKQRFIILLDNNCCELFPRRSRDQETLGYLSSRSYSLLRTRCASLQSSKSNYCSAQ